MCPPCRIFLIGLDHPPSCLTLPFEKISNPDGGYLKKIALTPPIFVFKFVLNPPQLPWQKYQIGFDPPPPGLTLPARK